MTLQEKNSADTRKTVCENMPLPFPATVLCKKDITRKRPIWSYRGFTSCEQIEWLHNTLPMVKRIFDTVPGLTKWVCGKAGGYDFTGETFCWHLKNRMRKHAFTFPCNGAMQKGYGQHGCFAALFTTSKLNGCTSHANCQKSTTRHQFWLVVILTNASLNWLHFSFEWQPNGTWS